MRAKIPWLGELSFSNARLTTFLRYQINRYLNHRAALRFKFDTLDVPRALASSGTFESLKDYFAKTAIYYAAGNVKTKSSNEHTFASQAVPIPKNEESEYAVQNELPPSESKFRMTEELFRASLQAESGSPDSFWSHRLYRGPIVNDIETRPIVHYCRSSGSTEKTLRSYFMDQKVIGFDIEWKADALKFHGPRANVSLIQIASEERIGLFHVALFPKGDVLVSPSMRKILEDPTVSKVGVSIKSDCTRIKKHLNVECQGLFELSHLYKLVKYSQSKEFSSIDRKLVSLAKQVQEHFHLPLFKGGDVRHSDWSKKLELHQMIYAAADSYAAVQLYHTLELKRKSLTPMPPRPQHAELNIPIKYIKDVEVNEIEERDQSSWKQVFPNAEQVKPSRCKNIISTLTSKTEPKRVISKTSAEFSTDFTQNKVPEVEGFKLNSENSQKTLLDGDADVEMTYADSMEAKEENLYLKSDTTSNLSIDTAKIDTKTSQAPKYPLTDSKTKIKVSKKISISKTKKCFEPKTARSLPPIPTKNTLPIRTIATYF
ncbi:Exonuclease 3'-5' domain-containing protein 2 [Golovinomyces cichoracearum]|uniref:Exonuclease 3'-5' domain-containing protein 2 n=1 Tax=Golovinomyces cichoracearum TaxID=62708 RepID=A0A420IG55_9PEZI|nr:Exonuclease 3'-5' domain-containing protein 2 [Golovinomyces cichoracearum]